MNQTDCKFNLGVVFFRLLVFLFVLTQSAEIFAFSKVVPVIATMKARFPDTCRGVMSQQSGLCLLSSVIPKPVNSWLIKTKEQSPLLGRVVDYPVKPQVFLPLAPGDYFLYSKDGFDSSGFEMPFSIAKGMVRTIKTAVYKASGKGLAIQHFTPSGGANGAGCSIREMGSKPFDVLPGNYLVHVTSPGFAKLPCSHGGVAFNALAGAAYKINSRRHVRQELSSANRFHHPDGLSSLTSISQFRDDIHELAILPKWRSFNSIVNPHRTLYSALVLSGIGTRTYIIPLAMKRRKSGCGRSLALGGLASMPVLTDCRFVGRKLTDFKVQAGGSYYAFNNRHGAVAIEGNNINNSVFVKGLSAVIE